MGKIMSGEIKALALDSVVGRFHKARRGRAGRPRTPSSLPRTPWRRTRRRWTGLGFVTKMSATERSTALVEALTAMEPGQVALRTGLTPEEMLVMLSPQATKDQATAGAVSKLRQFLDKFSPPMSGPLAKGNRVSAMLRDAKMTFREYWMKVYGLGLKQVGDVSLHAGFGEAELQYITLVETTPAREAGIYRNARTGEHAVVQGSGNFNDGMVPHMNALPGAGGDRWILVEHYHPERNRAVQSHRVESTAPSPSGTSRCCCRTTARPTSSTCCRGNARA